MKALKGSALIPAPGRGRYDRALSRSRRQAEQRERLLVAVAEAFAVEGRSASLRAVVERAGTGRNTFYEYFDDVEHALRAVRARIVARLEGALEAALLTTRTPVERLRAVSRACYETLEAEPYEAALGLCRERENEALSPVGRALSVAYLRAVGAMRSLAADDELKAVSVAAGAEAIFRECVLTPLLKPAQSDVQARTDETDEQVRVGDEARTHEQARGDEQVRVGGEQVRVGGEQVRVGDEQARAHEQARGGEQVRAGDEARGDVQHSIQKGNGGASGANRTERGGEALSKAFGAARPKAPVEMLVELAVRVLR